MLSWQVRDLASRYLGALSIEPSLDDVAQRLLAAAVDKTRGRTSADKVIARPSLDRPTVMKMSDAHSTYLGHLFETPKHALASKHFLGNDLALRPSPQRFSC